MTPPPYLALVRERLLEAADLAGRTKKAFVLVLQQFPGDEEGEPLVPPVRESIANVLAFVELGTAAQAESVLSLAAGQFDVVALDCDHKLRESAAIVAAVGREVPADRLLRYSDNQAWFDSALDMVQRIEHGVPGKATLVCGAGVIADQLRYVLPRLGARMVDAEGPERAAAEIVLGASQKRSSIDLALVEALPAAAAIYDLGIGSLSPAAAERARQRGLRLYRLDNRAGISSAIVRLLETDHMVRRLMGHVQVRGVDIVAGGLLAPAGAVVVDDITNPSVIFGVSDGAGRFRPQPLAAEDRARMEFVQSLMVKVS